MSEPTHAEIKKFYADFDTALNSEKFKTDPSVALPFFDEKRMRLFDMTFPEQHGPAIFRDHFIASSLQVPSEVHFIDMQIHSGETVAFTTYIQHAVGQFPNGPSFDLRIRAMDGLEKINGKWQIVNQHLSVPHTEATMGTVVTMKK